MTARTSDLDLTTTEFARILSTLEPHLPISDSFESDLPQKTGAWWTSQREHLVVWFVGRTPLARASSLAAHRTPAGGPRTTAFLQSMRSSGICPVQRRFLE